MLPILNYIFTSCIQLSFKRKEKLIKQYCFVVKTIIFTLEIM
jgi:hypothetical protein